MRSQRSILGSLLVGVTTTLASPASPLSSFVESRASSLDWAPCDLDLPENAMREQGYCATLEVPLDYTDPDSDETIHLQLLRFNATKEPFKGSVLWNPGGPGISGIETFAYLGADFRDIIGGHHHAISFDPRGTGRTIPFSCTKKASTSKKTRRSQVPLAQADLWSYVKKEKWEAMTSLAETCYETEQEHGRFIGTAFTARDMIKIVDALGEDGKLRYWGISYGTILGQVVASMFPDRIDRLLLDSNSLADDYLTSTGTGGPKDAEKALNYFFDECVQVGPETCALANYSGSDTTAQDLSTAVEKLFQKLVDTPELPADSGLSEADFPYGGNSILQAIKYSLLNLLSSPLSYSTIVQLLSYALEGSYKKALSLSPTDESEWNLGTQSFAGIACSDTSFRVESADDLYAMYQSHLAESTFGDALAADYMNCGAWKFDSAEEINTNELRNVKTSYPVLVINGAYDPFTPLSMAWQVASRFRDSRMIVHEGIGHGVTSHASNCTLNAIADYFTEGTLPEIGTVCKPNMLAFEYAKYLLGL
ncbi:Alpha/Beta hydrolase protein [Ilyonectria robusta]|uniref:Alpha/Beta hydrolase protein n=1 Tax=Ilyonectria robusta TaxID=1079257 RepID=UPI001E8D7662|nr:Alpha/Beta hydrolase protein [Ilyonectria robusta]KAH8679398.1 Alpha/Beta hydrolase protein [Ilyonectria robusta]